MNVSVRVSIHLYKIHHVDFHKIADNIKYLSVKHQIMMLYLPYMSTDTYHFLIGWPMFFSKGLNEVAFINNE